MILRVAQIALLLLYGEPGHQSLEYRVERLRRALELDHFASEVVDASRHVGTGVEDVVLDLINVLLAPGTTGP